MVTWGHLQVGYRNVKKQCAAFVCVWDIYIYKYPILLKPSNGRHLVEATSYQNPPKPRAPRINTTEPWFLDIFDDMIRPAQVRPRRLIMLLGKERQDLSDRMIQGSMPWDKTKKHEKNELHCESLAVKLPLFLSLVWCFDVHWYFCCFC